MLKLAGFVSLVFTSGVAVLWFGIQDGLLDGDCQFPSGWMNLSAIQERARRLDAQLQAHQQFIAMRASIFQALGRRRLSLPEACEKVRSLAEEVYPRFWVTLAMAEGKNFKEKMGRLIVSDFDMHARTARTATARARLQRITDEFASSAFQDWCQRSPNWESPEAPPPGAAATSAHGSKGPPDNG